jgi:Tfp pilus assembly protein PilF
MRLRTLLALLLVAACAGCGPTRNATVTPPADPTARDNEAAVAHNRNALALLRADKPADAEAELKAAVASDLLYGPAHNNLGIVYYRQKKYYDAAWEFQAAVKLMPRKAEPLNNLGLVFEASGRLDEAPAYYEKALALEPRDYEATANLARVRTRTNQRNDRTRQLLVAVVAGDPRPAWVAWAREQLLSMPAPQEPALPDRESPVPPPATIEN